MDKIILTASDLDGYLTDADKSALSDMDQLYAEALESSRVLATSQNESRLAEAKERLIKLYNDMGRRMQEVTQGEENIKVYSFQTPRSVHGEASRLIAKLRDVRTQQSEFVYYIQRAYELLFNLAFGDPEGHRKNHLIVKTPVTAPVQNFAVHKIPDVDAQIENSVMCVMLRGALLPSMIMSKEIQEYSSTGYVTPFALFKIRRDDSKKEANMEYILDLQRSYYSLADLDGKDLIFADPMNATGGSLVTIINYIKQQGIKPRSVQFFNVISSLKGTLQVVRAIEGAQVYTLWMDPVLNDMAYILPGLGDAGDRLNGSDQEEYPRNMIQLLADYGAQIANLYRSQLAKIEQTVLRVE
ncbi:uracil phosphoribosyltransferase [Spirochaeta africana]|uniref:Uracil phosphoribosyltransferase n=1 Tax=Spirochaeta africana (strain ATCC 700263 / DSM 8902 / Z-7692) TaxID=889378 RepID=H9UKZ8_SPIAZ|nr:uracil phosphoribosyltransferase [Spirochaeta africana]AFG38191.1 uracil phosphoribosyltransferase [Spirochaeta africana DSM 8902]